MAKEWFEDFNFRESTYNIIMLADNIINEYLAQGYKLTLRQLYYQFVARDLIENSQRSYKRLGKIVSNGRMAGLLDWDAIEDRTRDLKKNSHWSSPSSIISASARGFRIDKWARQPNRIEVWIEKEALIGVIERVCKANDVAYFACKGYVSQSEMYDAGKRFAQYAYAGQEIHVLHLGDHDPSGIDMTRDIQDRATTFAERFVDLDRLALNFDQIFTYNPPPNPAKVTDSRYDQYVTEYGYESWELDALDPATLSEVIEIAILDLRDDDLWEVDLEKEAEMRQHLAKAANNWDQVTGYLDGFED